MTTQETQLKDKIMKIFDITKQDFYNKADLVRKGDQPAWKGGITPERQQFYSTEEWSDAVKGVWKRDNAICQNCKKHHNTTKSRGTFHIHHIVSF
jgi:hypothetical protein